MQLTVCDGRFSRGAAETVVSYRIPANLANLQEQGTDGR
jgi:hypothetical protein